MSWLVFTFLAVSGVAVLFMLWMSGPWPPWNGR